MKTYVLIIGDGIVALVLSKILLEKEFQTIIVSKKVIAKNIYHLKRYPHQFYP